MVNIGNDWDTLLKEEFQKEYYLALREFLKREYSTCKVYPPMGEIFNALKYTSYENTRVVILGQDPYHEIGQAQGLCFSVSEGIPFPPSLQNIFKELKNEYGMEMPKSGSLIEWAKQGVLLLNTTLTVREGQAMSHAGRGWEILTDRIISLLAQKKEPIVFLLWGGHARKKKELIRNGNHCILECAHPSPLSAYNGFFGCNHFKLANAFLRNHGKQEIDWTILSQK